MKRIKWILSFALVLQALFTTTSAMAESPREQLKQMVEQLQKTPDDSALREKIIKLAPALPDEALRHEGRGKFAFKNAKSSNDYLDAAKEYEQAAQIAPWVPGYYADLCTIYESAGKYIEAKRNCEVYLSTLTDQKEIAQTKEKIAGLEYGLEKSSPAEHERKFFESLDGGVWKQSSTYSYNTANGSEWPTEYVDRDQGYFIQVHGKDITFYIGHAHHVSDIQFSTALNGHDVDTTTIQGRYKLRISEDGQTIVMEVWGKRQPGMYSKFEFKRIQS